MRKTCFVIAPIGNTGSETRKRSDQILKHLIKPVVQTLGYEAVRADEISEPGMITSQIIEHVVEDTMVIADLTGRNPNVFYELALRHAIKKPLIQIIEEGEAIPFDVAGMRTISVNHKDLDSVEEAKNELLKQIEATENKEPEALQSPISVSLDLKALRESQKPGDRSIADIFRQLSEIHRLIDQIDKKGLSEQALVLIGGLLHDANNFLMAMQGGVSLLQVSFSHPDEYPSKEKVAMQLAGLQKYIDGLYSLLAEASEAASKGRVQKLADLKDRLMKG